MILRANRDIVNPMPKIRKTRQEKIILKLKRELSQKGVQNSSSNTIPQVRQEAILTQPNLKLEENSEVKKIDTSALSFNPKLVKMDVLKTLALTVFIISLEIVLYLRLR